MLKMPRFSFQLPVYVALNLAFSSVVLSTAPAPTNLSVTCHNFKNMLYWNYSEPDLRPEFTINIHRYTSGLVLVRTNQTYLDVSEYTEDTDGYYITVEAQPEGSEEKVVSEGTRFSYSEDFDTDIECVVDFPALEISVQQHKLEFSFSHPCLVHNVEALKKNFEYIVLFNEVKSSFDCYCDEEVCTEEIQLYDNFYGRCVNVRVEGSVNGIPTEISRDVCDPVAPDNTDWTMLLTILLCSGVGLVLLIILGALIFKKLTQPDSQSTIISKILGMVNSDRVVHVPEQPALSEVMSVGHTPLMETTDQALLDFSTPTCDKNPLFPTHVPTHFNTDAMLPEEEDHGEVTDEADSGDFNSGNSFSGYDSHKFPIDMGQGDIVEAYGPR
ncbi:hypothetical protein PHYPO_G00182490 [Pangasianodon hypophthalmus]|uniref:Fibronectin type-III domain-containing protein n=1 Tax=Pangasianodon hypophthalmus TaxID=310915 RepID=A0A5N5PQW4_PANHP|nr:hypothetical protein PHYPO_G00182490 [Pangasianodon hypophthalmus]